MTPLRHYVLVPVDPKGAPHTACGLGRVTGRYTTTVVFTEVTCPGCRAFLVDLQLSRPAVVFQ